MRGRLALDSAARRAAERMRSCALGLELQCEERMRQRDRSRARTVIRRRRRREEEEAAVVQMLHDLADDSGAAPGRVGRELRADPGDADDDRGGDQPERRLAGPSFEFKCSLDEEKNLSILQKDLG